MDIGGIIQRFFRSFQRVFHRTTIRAVHEDDLPLLLTSLGIKAEIMQGKCRCMSCDELITMDNLWGIISKKGEIHLICSSPDCLAAYTVEDER